MEIDKLSSLRVPPENPVSPALLNTPSNIIAEVTTRCNLFCPMCVKHTVGSGISEGDLSFTVFKSLTPALSRIASLVLSGIGEPLLHPQLDTFIQYAKTHMPTDSWVGFQSNGLLLDEERARSLIDAGLDRICLSVDAALPETYRTVRKGGELAGIEHAFASLRKAGLERKDSPLEIGVEFVLQQNNMAELPEALRWASEQGATFALVSHMIAYDPTLKTHVAYDPNTDEAIALFERWKERADNEGIDIPSYFNIKWKYRKNAAEQRVVDFVEAMINDAAGQGIFFHLRNLIERDESLRQQLEQAFLESESIAREIGLDLKLPAVTPKGQKKCEFIESGGVFVSWDGNVHPCHFLWHRYSCYVSEWRKYVNPKIFGNLSESDILEIWNSPEFRSFRETVLGYEYPLCSNCNVAPCDYIESEEFEQDCYTNTIPCCDCQWCLGVFQCLL